MWVQTAISSVLCLSGIYHALATQRVTFGTQGLFLGLVRLTMAVHPDSAYTAPNVPLQEFSRNVQALLVDAPSEVSQQFPRLLGRDHDQVTALNVAFETRAHMRDTDSCCVAITLGSLLHEINRYTQLRGSPDDRQTRGASGNDPVREEVLQRLGHKRVALHGLTDLFVPQDFLALAGSESKHPALLGLGYLAHAGRACLPPLPSCAVPTAFPVVGPQG